MLDGRSFFSSTPAGKCGSSSLYESTNSRNRACSIGAFVPVEEQSGSEKHEGDEKEGTSNRLCGDVGRAMMGV